MKFNKLFKTGYFSSSRKNGEKGQALAIVLCLLLVVSLVMASALTFVGTSFKTNKTYANNTNQLYSAEAGIQDGIWQLLNLDTNDINDIPGFTPATYYPFDYSNNGNNGWNYPLVNSTTTPATTIFNGYPVNINLKNTWVPLVDANNPSPSYTPPGGVYTPPTLGQVTAIFAGSLIISGSVTTIPVYNAKITNTGASSLPILSIGCWLPQGFTYTNASSNFYQYGQPHNSTTQLFSNTTENPVPCAGNEAMVWTFPAGTTFAGLQAAMGEAAGQVLTFSFSYTTALSKLPECLPWVVWGTSAGQFTWDADITVNDMVAEAGNATDGWTDIEAYVPKSKTRVLGNALSGDYVAIGGANLYDQNGDGLREVHEPSSNATVQSGSSAGQIPTGSSVEAAYLYWGGWARGDGTDTVSVAHDGSNFYDPTVTLQSPGHTDTLTVSASNPDDQINYAPVWSGRGAAITITAGSSTIVGTGSLTGDDVRVGDIIGTSASALNLTGTYTVTAVNVGGNNAKITVSPTPTVSSGGAVPYWVFDGYYYGCKTDVTNIIRNYSNNANLSASPKVYGDGTGTYTVSSNYFADTQCVQDPGTVCTAAWAGWSLVIVYSNPTTLGHQLYLFDDFKSIATNSGANLTQISGFIVPNPVAGDTGGDAVKITAFVGEGDKFNTGDYFAIRNQSNTSTDNILWDGVTDDTNDTSSGGADVSATALDAFNSESVWYGVPVAYNGIDIDTFHVKWTDDMLSTSTPVIQSNDTTATLNIYSMNDGLVSIYLIASFRSSVASGGSVSYLIHKKPPS